MPSMAQDDKQLNEEMLIDTSKMSEEKAASMEMTESARETEWVHPSFASQIFMGVFDTSMVTPFPEQSEEDKKIGDEFTDSLSDYLKDHLDGEEVDATRTIPQDVIDELIKRGVFAMKIPKEYNGLGFSQVNYNRVITLIASHCASTAVMISAHQSIGVPQPLRLFGTDEQKNKILPRFRNGAISGFALTEPDVGSDPAQMKMTATLTDDGQSYLLNGKKLWCTNGPIADIMVVMALTEPKMVKGKERKQITAFIVEKEMPGIETIHRCDFMGIRGIQNGVMVFKDVKVPAENIVWGKGLGLKLALITLNAGRLTLASACSGVAKQCLRIARKWGNERKQWGLPIGLHEEGRTKIAFIASTTFAIEAVAYLTCHWADKGNIDIRLEAAMAKLFCTEAAWYLTDATLQLRGGRGYEKASSLKGRGEKGYPVERMLRDCRINRIIEGTTEIMHLFLAREAMEPHLKVAAELLKKHTPMGKKIKAGLKLATYYSTWYPSQWVNSSIWTSHKDMGILSDHFSYIDKTSHKLARTIFHYIGLYQDRLERKQNLLANLMEIGTELYAMSATCSYAIHLSKKDKTHETALELADVFCLAARRRIKTHFVALKHNDDKKNNRLAKSILNGKMTWLEKGIVPQDDEND